MNATWILRLAGWCAAGYLLGSIPVAWLLTWWVTGKDLRRLGSGNVGVMNTAISTHRWVGLLVFLGEIAKGVLAVTIPRQIGAGEAAIALTVVFVVIGTRWPVWLGFKGGRGNSAGLAGTLLISWQVLVFLAALWMLVRFLLKSSYTATRITFFMLPVGMWVATRSWWYTLAALALLGLYLEAQRRESDDHLLLKEHWPSFWRFLTSPPRRD